MKRRSSSRLAKTFKASPPIQNKLDNKKKRTTYKASDDGYSTGNESELGSVDDYVADEAFFDSNDFLPRKRIASMKTVKALREVQKQKNYKDNEEEDEEEVEDEEEELEESDDEGFSENEGCGKRTSKGRSQRRKRDAQGKEKSQKERSKEVYDALEQKRRYFAVIDKHELVIEKM